MNPILRAEVIAVDLAQVIIICPICGLFHRHGSCGDIAGTNYGTRVPHCNEQRFQGEYELVTTDYTIRKARLQTQDIEAWRDIQRSRRATIVDQWREQEAAELDTRILAAVRDIHAHGRKLSRWRITLWAGVTPHAVTMWMHQHGIYYGGGRYRVISRSQAGPELCKIFGATGSKRSMSKTGKSRMKARVDLMRSRAASGRRRQRAQKSYDPKRYDKPISEEI